MRKESKIIFIITLCKKKVRDFPSSSACSKLIILWNLDLVQNRAKFPFEFFFHKLSKCLVSTHLENNYLLLFFKNSLLSVGILFMLSAPCTPSSDIWKALTIMIFVVERMNRFCFAGRNIFRKTVQLFLYNFPCSIGIHYTYWTFM